MEALGNGEGYRFAASDGAVLRLRRRLPRKSGLTPLSSPSAFRQ